MWVCSILILLYIIYIALIHSHLNSSEAICSQFMCGSAGIFGLHNSKHCIYGNICSGSSSAGFLQFLVMPNLSQSSWSTAYDQWHWLLDEPMRSTHDEKYSRGDLFSCIFCRYCGLWFLSQHSTLSRLILVRGFMVYSSPRGLHILSLMLTLC